MNPIVNNTGIRSSSFARTSLGISLPKTCNRLASETRDQSVSGIPVSLSDNELYQRCKEYGLNARLWLRKFAGLLPEVYQRHLYKQKGYVSIHEFAAKLAGMNHDTVDKILRISEKVKDKPLLRKKLENGTVGWSKIEAVAYVATPKTDSMWAEKVEMLSRQTLEEYVRQYKKQFAAGGNAENQQTFMQHGRNGSGLRWNTITFSVHPDIEERLRLMKQKIEKEKGEGVGWNEVMKEMFRQIDQAKSGSKDEGSGSGKKTRRKTMVQLCPDCVKKRTDEAEQARTTTRHIPAEVRKIISVRSAGICEFEGCLRPAEIYHHTRRFALRKNHDPEFIRALCKKHEGILQAGLVVDEEKSPEYWKIREEPPWWDLKTLVDERVAEFRREPAAAAAADK